MNKYDKLTFFAIAKENGVITLPENVQNLNMIKIEYNQWLRNTILYTETVTRISRMLLELHIVEARQTWARSEPSTLKILNHIDDCIQGLEYIKL